MNMNLPDLDSTEMLLGLDIVAEWQLEQVRTLELWYDWKRCAKQAAKYNDPSWWKSRAAKGEDSDRMLAARLLCYCKDEKDDVHFVAEVSWHEGEGDRWATEGDFHLVVLLMNEKQRRKWDDTDSICPPFIKVRSDSGVNRIDCEASEPPCVRDLITARYRGLALTPFI